MYDGYDACSQRMNRLPSPRTHLLLCSRTYSRQTFVGLGTAACRSLDLASSTACGVSHTFRKAEEVSSNIIGSADACRIPFCPNVRACFQDQRAINDGQCRQHSEIVAFRLRQANTSHMTWIPAVDGGGAGRAPDAPDASRAASN